MFCTNCGNPLPEGSKFCPNCGAKIITEAEAADIVAEEAKAALDSAGVPYPEVPAEAVTEAAAAVTDAEEAVTEAAEDIAEETVETVAAAVDEAAETAETVQEAAGDAVAEAVEETAEAAEEFTEAAEEAAEEAFEEAADTAEEVVEAAEETVDEAAEAVSETVEEAQEAVAETVEFAGDAADEVAEAVQETAEEVTEAAAEATESFGGIYKVVSQDAADTAGEIYAGAEEAVAYSNEEISEAAEAVAEMAEAAAEPADDALPYVSDHVIENPEVSPYTVNSVPDTGAAPKKKKSGLKALIAVLLIAALAVGGYFVYQNLPAQKVKRFKAAGAEAMEAGNFVEAAAQYKNALEIDPEDTESFDALIMMHEAKKNDAFNDAGLGFYEEALEEMKLANDILPVIEEEDLDNVMMIYYSWAGDLAYAGDMDGVSEVMNKAKADGLGDPRIAKIQEYVDRSKRLHDIESDLDAVSKQFTELQDNVIRTVLDTLVEKAPVLQEYLNDYSMEKYVYSFDGGKSAVVWKASSERDAVQVHIGEVGNDSEPSGVGETYFISSFSKDEKSYEYFMANWAGGAPNGPFTEADMVADPESEDHYRVTGQVKGNCVDGKYDGDVTNDRSGKVYNMKFDLGKVQVLDTVDPNGDEGNVVGYTDDHNSWITFSESGLNGSYGLRYIA